MDTIHSSMLSQMLDILKGKKGKGRGAVSTSPHGICQHPSLSLQLPSCITCAWGQNLSRLASVLTAGLACIDNEIDCVIAPVSVASQSHLDC